MAGGWSRDGAIQEQIDASIEDAVERARGRLPRGAGLRDCEECGEPAPSCRRADARHCCEGCRKRQARRRRGRIYGPSREDAIRGREDRIP